MPQPRRTSSGYRVYDGDVLVLLAFMKQARRLGFRPDEIKKIAAIRRSGRPPRPHVRQLVRRKLADVERALAHLTGVRTGLRVLVSRWCSPSPAAGGIKQHLASTPSTVCKFVGPGQEPR